MIFSTIDFLLFFIIVVLLLLVFKSEKAKKIILLAASYFFYGYWDYRFLALIIISSWLDFFCGKKIAELPDENPARKGFLILSLVGNLGMLFFFKYFNFFIDNANLILSGLGFHISTLRIILPVGISFYTFQSMSYTIDIYLKKLEPEPSGVNFFLFVSFFPQLVAGPIVRAADFLPQLKKPIVLTLDNFRVGGQIFLWGLVKKLLIADVLAIYVDWVFEKPDSFSTATIWLAVIGFALQIYGDFAGYSDMAIGCARVLGFELRVNFLFPYVSRSITEFWHRWHISLSTWLRDYLYIPLGGNRKGRTRTYINLMLTMLLGGLWHGASWNFVVWGGLHGLALAVDKFRLEKNGERQFKYKNIFVSAFSWLSTFAFVLFSWVFFRCPDMETSITVLKKMIGLTPQGYYWSFSGIFVIFAVMIAFSIYGIRRDNEFIVMDMECPLHYYLVAFLLILLFLFSPPKTVPFIYYQF